MGFLASIFGGGGPQTVGTTQQVNQNWQDVQSGIGQQQAFLNALMGQNAIGNQANVYNQLAQIASGQGPNPAQAMLNNATGQNIANQAALMGSQRGVSSNPGQIARLAAQQGGNLQQQAAGQAAQLQAQQALGALGAMGSLAQQQVAQQQAGLSQYNQAAQGSRGQTINGLTGQNATAANIANGAGSNILGGVGQAALGVANNLFSSPKSQGASLGGDIGGAVGALVGLAQGGEVPDQDHVLSFLMGKAEGGAISGEHYANMKEKVPGKAKKEGNSYANDTVPAMLSPGEIIVPRSHANDPEKAAKFAAAVAMKNKRK